MSNSNFKTRFCNKPNKKNMKQASINKYINNNKKKLNMKKSEKYTNFLF